MKANIAINNDLINEAMNLSKLRTKKQVVEIALKEFIRIKKQQKALEPEGKLKGSSKLEEMHQEGFIFGSGHLGDIHGELSREDIYCDR